MPHSSIFGFAILFLAVSPLQAKDAQRKAVVADTPEKFQVLVESIHEQMAPGERYEFLNERDRVKVDRSFEIMNGLLTKHGSVDTMPIEVKTKLFTEQERVNGLLARNADDRLVCDHVAPVGSHIPTTTCHTVRELNTSRKKSRDQFDDLDRKANADYTRNRPGGG